MADRTVIVKQVINRRTTFATAVIKSPGGFHYFLFATKDQTKALRLTERKALKVLDSWRGENITNANNCSIEAAT